MCVVWTPTPFSCSLMGHRAQAIIVLVIVLLEAVQMDEAVYQGGNTYKYGRRINGNNVFVDFESTC